MRVRGFLAGYLGLIAFSAIVSPSGSQRFAGKGGLMDTLTKGVQRALSPGVAAIPDYAGAKASSRGGSDLGARAAAAVRGSINPQEAVAPRPASAGGGGGGARAQ